MSKSMDEKHANAGSHDTTTVNSEVAPSNPEARRASSPNPMTSFKIGTARPSPSRASKSLPKNEMVPEQHTPAGWDAQRGVRLPPGHGDSGSLHVFRCALGINTHLGPDITPSSLEQGRRSATGIYRAVLDYRRNREWQHTVLGAVVYIMFLAQIVFGAALTALGPTAANHAVLITVFGAVNTIIAGVLALLKGQGLPERLRKDAVEFRRLQDWIEETEALLTVGVLGREEGQVETLIASAFGKYNAVMASKENNKPSSYVRQQAEAQGRSDGRPNSRGSDISQTGNAIVHLTPPTPVSRQRGFKEDK